MNKNTEMLHEIVDALSPIKNLKNYVITFESELGGTYSLAKPISLDESIPIETAQELVFTDTLNKISWSFNETGRTFISCILERVKNSNEPMAFARELMSNMIDKIMVDFHELGQPTKSFHVHDKEDEN